MGFLSPVSLKVKDKVMTDGVTLWRPLARWRACEMRLCAKRASNVRGLG